MGLGRGGKGTSSSSSSLSSYYEPFHIEINGEEMLSSTFFTHMSPYSWSHDLLLTALGPCHVHWLYAFFTLTLKCNFKGMY